MKDIKFRAWDGETMVSPDYVDRSGWAYWKANSIPTSSNEVMHSTGLKDSKGQEIYEGDIVRGKFEEKNIQAPIIWCNYCYYAGYIGDDTKNKTALGWILDLEVIGNRYENPELLERGDC